MSESGFWELIVIFVLALLVIGPERLPEVAKKVGYWVGKVRRYVAKVRSDVESEFRTDELHQMLEDQSKEIQNLRTIVSQAHEQSRFSAEEMDAAIKESVADVKSTVAEAMPTEPPQKVLPGDEEQGKRKASNASQAHTDSSKGAPEA
ncbi:MAG: Sec-independent protein translocase protein TatB [bacterium]